MTKGMTRGWEWGRKRAAVDIILEVTRGTFSGDEAA